MAEKKLYEGMFLVDSAKAASDWDGVNTAIKRILDRAEAEIVSIRKWDDRRLAYDIKGVSRGTYLLCYFRADGRQIQSIEKAFQLSETIMRVLILSTDQMSQEDIEKDTPAMKAEKEKEKAVAEQDDETETGWQGDQEDEPAEDEVSLNEESPIEEAARAAEDIESLEETAETEEQEDSQPKIVSDD
ncbi:MAG: 30S ribosomal protein S6 [Sedimentisphaerales bacterium]|nr:30S ribosomal protein S6 [Sedimentisphaerales bacterium]